MAAMLDEVDTISTALSATVSQYSLPEEEIDVELADDVLTAVSKEPLEFMVTALERESLLTPKNKVWSSDSSLSTALSATASEYSLPESETDVDMTLLFRVGDYTVRDGLYCLSQLKNYQPVSVHAESDMLDIEQSVSEYEMPPSETDVTVAELCL